MSWPEAPLSGHSWILSVLGTRQGEKKFPQQTALTNPAWHQSKAAGHLLGWADPSRPSLSGIPRSPALESPGTACLGLEHLEGGWCFWDLAARAPGALDSALEGGWAPRDQQIACWPGGPWVPALMEQRTQVSECLGREDQMTARRRQAGPKGPWGIQPLTLWAVG